MKILVPVKRVTDPNVKVKLLPDGSGVDTANVDFKINPYDEYALEEALRLREKHGGRVDEIVVLSVGDSASTKELRVAMAMGADRAILVECDDSQYDPSVMAQIMTAVIRDESPELVLMGKLAVDGENSQVAQMVAHALGWPQASFALEVELLDESMKVSQTADGGQTEIEVALPAIVSRADMPEEDVRYASLPGIMKARRKPLKTITPDDLGVDTTPRVRILGYETPPKREAGEILETVDELVDKLQNEVKVL